MMNISPNDNAPTSRAFEAALFAAEGRHSVDDDTDHRYHLQRPIIGTIDDDTTSLSSFADSTTSYDHYVATPRASTVKHHRHRQHHHQHQRRRGRGGRDGNNRAATGPLAKPYSCPTCRRGYCSERSLSVHLLSHEPGARRYACPECPRTFVAGGYLKLHMRAHGRRRSRGSSISDLDASSLCNDDLASNLSFVSASGSSCDSRMADVAAGPDELSSMGDDTLCDEVFRKLRRDEIDRSLVTIDFYSF